MEKNSRIVVTSKATGLFPAASRWLATLAVALSASLPLSAQYRMENLGRGVVAVRGTSTDVFVSWRMLGTDPDDIAFNLYRSTGGGAATKLNASPLSQATSSTDATADLTQTNEYFVRPVIGSVEQAQSATFTLSANAPVRQYLSIPLTPPAGGTTPDAVAYTYSANDCSAGDLDGDGEYEIVLKWDPSNSKDNSQSGHTGDVFLDAYKLDGTRLWRIDLGRNIRAGAHYTQFMVADLDGDGRAEVACKTADGTIDGVGVVIGDAAADYRNTAGYVLSGPEFLTIFDGLTGSALATTNYVPARGAVTSWGDNYGNRVDRFLACVAWLDGRHPSLVMCRGYYTRAVLAAWDWRGGALTQRWVFDSDDGTPGNSNYRGQGAHSLTVGDVDGDGRDEIIYGAAAIDDNGRALYSTQLGHGDALHLSDMNPDRPGQEVWMVHEDPGSYGPNGLELRDAATGALLFGASGEGSDVGRGVAFDIDPRYKGYEMWGARGGLYNAQGTQISATHPSSMNFAVWWDGDLLREILDSNRIDKWNWTAGTTSRLLTATGCSSNNGTKSTPCLCADILGDWREEVIWRTTDSSELRIFTTTSPTTYRFTTLMHDPQYRASVMWQNTAYNQPTHPGFYLGEGMPTPAKPYITTSATIGSSRLANLSVRTDAGIASDTLILGFVVGGNGAPQSVLVRGVGPTLASFNVPGAISDPRLDLFHRVGSLDVITSGNDDWSSDPGATAVAATAATLQAFPLPSPSRDAALLNNLTPGAYTVQISPASGGTGIALAEIYAADLAGNARLVNASARARAGTGDQTLIAGFVVNGNATRTVLIRGIGPGLAQFGVGGVLADPQLDIYRGAAHIASNDDWSTGSGATTATFDSVFAFPLPAGSKDAALVMTLAPGAYTAHVSGVGSTSGVALVEIYELND